MDLNPKERLRTTVLLLILSRVVHAKGLSHNLQCINDYVSTINCTLQQELAPNITHWLKLEREEEEEDEEEEVETWDCRLFRDNNSFSCSVVYDVFVDTDVFKIFLCDEGERCELLDKEYSPVKNIKPRPPCCLSMTKNSSQHHFNWKSNYEDLTDYTALDKYLTYQLHLHQKGPDFKETQHDFYMDEMTYTVPDEILKPDSECIAKVRSQPSKGPSLASYMGQWSSWSAVVRWRTEPKVDGSNPDVGSLKKLLILLCLLVPVFLSLCFTSVKRWRQKAFIPTPEPYFHSLYKDCQGDFKSWVIMEKTADLPKTEKSSRIEKIFERKDIPEVDPKLLEDRGYANMSDPEFALLEPGLPYAVTTSGPVSATTSCTSACLGPECPAEGDSGCWLSSDQSLEHGHLWYCNDYCTLSSFQQSALGMATVPLKCATCLTIRHGELEEIHTICE